MHKFLEPIYSCAVTSVSSTSLYAIKLVQNVIPDENRLLIVDLSEPSSKLVFGVVSRY